MQFCLVKATLTSSWSWSSLFYQKPRINCCFLVLLVTSRLRETGKKEFISLQKAVVPPLIKKEELLRHSLEIRCDRVQFSFSFSGRILSVSYSRFLFIDTILHKRSCWPMHDTISHLWQSTDRSRVCFCAFHQPCSLFCKMSKGKDMSEFELCNDRTHLRAK